MLNCHDVARYLLTLMSEEEGDLISNLKLQKLVYYAQGASLALFKRPLFPESIEAWLHGPVVPELYYTYQKYDPGAIPRPRDVDFEIYDSQTTELLNEVYATFGQYSSWKLAQMTREETPWKEVYETTQLGRIISLNSLKTYFETYIVQTATA